MREQCTLPGCVTTKTEELNEEKGAPANTGHVLQLSIRQYGKLLDALPDAMVIAGRAGKIVEINTQLVELFGYAREDLLGKNLEILMPERFRARHRRNVVGVHGQPPRASHGDGA